MNIWAVITVIVIALSWIGRYTQPEAAPAAGPSAGAETSAR